MMDSMFETFFDISEAFDKVPFLTCLCITYVVNSRTSCSKRANTRVGNCQRRRSSRFALKLLLDCYYRPVFFKPDLSKQAQKVYLGLKLKKVNCRCLFCLKRINNKS